MAKSNNNLNAVFTDTANAIRGKTGSSAPITPRDFADEIAAIPVGGEDKIPELLMGTISEYNDVAGSVTYIKSYAFASCSSLKAVSFPNCTSMSNYVFTSTALESASFPELLGFYEGAEFNDTKLTSFYGPKVLMALGNQTFGICSLLKEINLPLICSLGNGMFSRCYSLQSVFVSNATTVSANAFARCWSLESLNLPNATQCASYAFVECTALRGINCPLTTLISSYAFSGCFALESINAPYTTVGLGNNAFYNCSSLSYAEIGLASLIANNAFYGCSSLSILRLNYSSVATLNNYNAFYNTPMSDSSYLGYFGSIYVPASLVASYKTATNWAAYSDRIAALESEYSNKYVFKSEFNGSTWAQIEPVLSSKLSLIEYIGEDAFRLCSDLTELSLPECQIIYASAFYSCSALSSIYLPECKIIYNQAFGFCKSLTSIILPECRYIGGAAFNNCSSLLSMYLLYSNIINIEYAALGGGWPSNYSIYVRASLLSYYSTSRWYWAEIFSHMAGLTDEEIANLLGQ